MITCEVKGCNGFITESREYEEIIEGQKNYVRFVFCSNALCDYNERKYRVAYFEKRGY